MIQNTHLVSDFNRSVDNHTAQEASILPIASSLRGRGIGVSVASRSKIGDGRSGSRQNRKPIFSKDHNSMSSEGFRSYKPSEIRAEEQKNAQPISSLVRRLSSPSEFTFKNLEGTKETEQAQLYCSNILNLMREQLEISTANTQAKMNEQIKKNNEELIRLENKLKETEATLVKREVQMGDLREMLDRAVLNARCVDPKELGVPGSDQFSKNFEYLTSRLRDVEIKIRTVSSEFNFSASSREAVCVQQLSDKLDILTQRILTDYRQKVEFFSQKVQNLNGSYEMRYQELESKMAQLGQGLTDSHSYEKKLSQLEERSLLLKKELENTGRQVQGYASKEFKYDNYELKTLRAKVEALIQSVGCFEGEKGGIDKYLAEIQAQHIALVAQIKSEYESLGKASDQMCGSKAGKIRESRKLPNSIQSTKPLSHSNSLKLRSTQSSSSHLSLDDTFRPVEDQESFQNFEELNSQKSQGVIRRLIETIRQTRNPTPLKCQIDETGYLKYCKSGTYVFDVDGNLFQLTQNEIGMATNSRIILLS